MSERTRAAGAAAGEAERRPGLVGCAVHGTAGQADRRAGGADDTDDAGDLAASNPFELVTGAGQAGRTDDGEAVRCRRPRCGRRAFTLRPAPDAGGGRQAAGTARRLWQVEH